MNKKFKRVSVSEREGQFDWYVNSYGYEELERESILNYYNEANNDDAKSWIKNEINDTNLEIMELIEKRALLDKEIEYMESAEKIKNKNIKIAEYIDELKQDGKLNTYVVFEDYHGICNVIENGTYKFSAWYADKADKSWRTDKKTFEAGYIFSLNSILADNGKTIKSVSSKFDTQEEAIQYVERRKKVYEKYFKEEKPAIPHEYSYISEMFGVVLDGYTIETK
jgi:hypothetical protein